MKMRLLLTSTAIALGFAGLGATPAHAQVVPTNCADEFYKTVTAGGDVFLATTAMIRCMS